MLRTVQHVKKCQVSVGLNMVEWNMLEPKLQEKKSQPCRLRRMILIQARKWAENHWRMLGL